MKCMFCNEEMITGSIETGPLFSNILKADEMVVFIPEGEEKKLLPKNTVHLKITSKSANFCPKCGKAVAIFQERGNTFWQ